MRSKRHSTLPDLASRHFWNQLKWSHALRHSLIFSSSFPDISNQGWFETSLPRLYSEKDAGEGKWTSRLWIAFDRHRHQCRIGSYLSIESSPQNGCEVCNDGYKLPRIQDYLMQESLSSLLNSIHTNSKCIYGWFDAGLTSWTVASYIRRATKCFLSQTWWEEEYYNCNQQFIITKWKINLPISFLNTIRPKQ